MGSRVHLADSALDVLDRQDGAARVDQLVAAGMSTGYWQAQLAWGRWQQPCQTVVVTHNGPLTPTQQEWVAALGAGARAVLCGRSAAGRWGLESGDDGRIHVLVQRGTTVPQLGLPLQVHESRRYFPSDDPHPTKVPPMTSLGRSITDAAVWTKHARSACGLAIAAVQQRLTQPARLVAELKKAGKVRHRSLLCAVLVDVEGGAQALSEVDFAGICRRHGLPAPIRQNVRVDSHGRRRYIDAEMRTRRGRRLAIEIDGAAHLIVGSYWQDMARANEIVLTGQSLLRFPTVALYLDEATVVDQVRRAIND
jgi:hypothetical protein